VDEWNSFTFLSLICCIMGGASALLTLSARRTGPPLLWGLICLIMAGWSLGWFLCFSASDAQEALHWARNLNYVILLLPVLMFHFVITFVNRFQFLARMLWLYYAITLVYLASIVLWPDSFLINPVLRFNQFWFPLAGPLFYFFPVLFMLILGHSIHVLIKAREGLSRSKRLKVGYLIIAIVVGIVGGGSTIPLEFHIDIPPYGIACLAFINLFSTYAILKHDLLDLPETISVISARLLSYIGIFALVVFILKSDYFVFAATLSFEQLLILTLFVVLLCEVYASVKGRIQYLADNMLVRHRVVSETAVRKLMAQLEGAADFEDMLPFLRQFFEAQSYVHHYAWYMDQMLLDHASKKQSIQDYTRSKVLDDCVYQRILFSENDGRRHDQLPAILRLNALGVSSEKTAKQQMVELMSSEQLDSAYSWVEMVPDRELIALPVIAHEVFRGLILVVISRSDAKYTDQMTLRSLASKLAAMIERLEFYRRQSIQQQSFLLERMASLQALAGSIAHEMRTPLTQLGYFVSDVKSAMLDHGPLLDVSPNLMFQSAQAQTAIERSLQIIDITLGQVKNAPIDTGKFLTLSIHTVVNKALSEYVFMPGERDWVNCDLRQAFNFHGDETLLIYVLFNLLKNALYYAHCSKAFDITINCSMDEKYNILVFQDNGPGIAPDALEKIFDDFFSTDDVRGTGLGLSYCRRVMRAFGGDICCVSELGEFTEFQLKFLPLS